MHHLRRRGAPSALPFPILISTLVLPLLVERASAQFVNVATAALANNFAGVSGVAWGDFDRDGDLDLFMAKEEADKLFRNDGGGVWVDVTSSLPGGGDTHDGQGVAWADYDNDGDLDLYLGIDGYPNRLYRNEGGGVFVDAATGPMADAGVSAGLAWGDFNNDGNVDMYLANEGADRLVRNDGGGVFTDVTHGPLGNTGINPSIGWADYDNDGDLDVYIVNKDAPSVLMRNDGGTFVDATPLGLRNGISIGTSLAWGDYDNDGDLDIYLGNGGPSPASTASNKLFRNDGGGAFTEVTTSILADPGDADGVSWADYDNDADLDIYIANGDRANKLLRNDGGGVFRDATTNPMGDNAESTGLTWGDYDNDGDVDLFMGNQFNSNRLFRNDISNGYRWVQIELEGGARPGGGPPLLSNRSAIGARVRVVAGGVSQIREISGGSGNQSQPMLPAAFGLRAATTIDTIEVRWPSGIRWDTTGVAVNQRLKVHERPYTLAIAVVGSGAVASDPSQSGYGAGVKVNLSATPSPGYSFVGWSGDASGTDNPLSVVMNGHKSISASFADQTAPTVNVLTANGGEVWTEMTTHDITWTASDGVGVTEVDLELSLDSGSNWSPIASGQANTGSYAWTVPSTPSMTARLRVTARDAANNSAGDVSDADFEIAATVSVTGSIPKHLFLSWGKPNPFSRSTTISYALPRSEHVRLRVLDLMGRPVATLVDGPRAAGEYSVQWDGRLGDRQSAAPGLYFVRLDGGGETRLRKLLLTR